MTQVSHFQKSMQILKEDLLRMGGLVEEAIHEASAAMMRLDAGLAEQVIKGDRRIDLMQNNIEERALALLATQQPVAIDLRFLASVIKIVSFLERMGDQAENLARRVKALSRAGLRGMFGEIGEMGEIAQEMTRACLDSFVRDDVALARWVVRRDNDLDRMHRDFVAEIIRRMTDGELQVAPGIELILACRHQERIGDNATNVAEEVVFLVEGRMIRHTGEAYAGA